MREIKYRQRLANDTWHYWGFIDGTFVSPMLSDGVDDALKHSQQFTGKLDKNGVDVYEGDILKVYDWSFANITTLLGIVVVIWDEDEKGWRYDQLDHDACDQFRNVEVYGNIYSAPEITTS
ncbi:hypothetical protein KBC79_01480 [Candidatus Woesebacteria bacterium]|nr:hypothetical protein [Candidatus Woesebacteria bacterium]